jgi:hypothetical protein
MTAVGILLGLLIGIVAFALLVAFATWVAYDTVGYLRERDARGQGGTQPKT